MQRLDTILGQTYIQGNQEGLASYHFNFPLTVENDQGGSYISYETAPPMWKLQNGDKPPNKKYFDNPKYDADTRTFTGLIDWKENPFHGDYLWEYTMIFSADFTKIEGG